MSITVVDLDEAIGMEETRLRDKPPRLQIVVMPQRTEPEMQQRGVRHSQSDEGSAKESDGSRSDNVVNGGNGADNDGNDNEAAEDDRGRGRDEDDEGNHSEEDESSRKTKRTMSAKPSNRHNSANTNSKSNNSSTNADSKRASTYAAIQSHYRLSFSKVDFYVEKRSALQKLRAAPGERKQILHNVSGYVTSGQVLAIIGPSGAGKTTLLDILATRNKAANADAVRLNGEVFDRKLFSKYCSYMPQDDRLWASLTVRENLHFAAALTAPPSFTRLERHERVEEIIEELGLVSCANTFVGNVFIKGISGGQKRRTSIGYELVGNPSCLFLDEPTSGLDSASAAEIMSLLTQLAREKNLLVVTSIHQPSSDVYLNFDRVMLLTKGHVGYFGPAVKSTDYFDAIGFPCPEHMNPADHMLAISNSDFTEAASVEQVISMWRTSKEATTVESTVTSMGGKSTDLGAARIHPNFLARVWILMRRGLLIYAKDPKIYISRLFTYLFMSIFLGTLYINVKYNQTGVLDRSFLVMWQIAFFSYSAMSGLPSFTLERANVTKEVANGMYTAAEYALANALVQLPFVFVGTFVATAPAYWIGGPLNNSSGTYFVFSIILFCFLYVVESFATLLGALFTEFAVAIVAANSLLSVFFVMNGYFIKQHRITVVWRWLMNVSPHQYATRAMMYTAFMDQHYPDYESCLQAAQNATGSESGCYGSTASQILDGFGSGWASTNVGEEIGILISMAVIFRLLAWFVVLMRVK